MLGRADDDRSAHAALLGRALEHLRDAVLITEGERAPGAPARTIIYVNPAFTAMTGWSLEEARGRGPGITVGPGTDRAALARIQAAHDAVRPAREELFKYRKDGSTFWAEADVVPILGADGACELWLGVLRDITERKVLEERVRQAERLASLGTLTSGVAHEINNPLAYVTTNIEHAREELASARARAHGGLVTVPRELVDELLATLDDARDGARRIRATVADLKAFSRPEAAALVPGRLEEPIRAALRMAHGVLGSAQLTVSIAEGLRVRASVTQLANVFLELLSNAGRAVERVDGARRAVAVRAFSVGSDAVVEVVDRGEGIAEADLPHIFDPFFSRRGVGGGSGLGLSVAHGVITAHGGRIAVESAHGAGTTVRVTIPLAIEDARAGVASATPAPPRRPRVLIVDDEVHVARALARALGRRHDVRAVNSGAEALASIAEDAAIDAIVCDVLMPGMSGAELYAAIAEATPQLVPRVLFVTGGAATPEARAFLDTVSAPCLEKPVELATLEAAIAARIAPP